MSRKLLLSIFFFILLCPLVSSLTPEERVFFNQLVEKQTAQVQSKLDLQSVKLDKDVTSKIESARETIKQDIANEIKKTFLAVVIGLTGCIIVTFSVFKVIELNLDYTTRIKKYEKKLVDSMKEIEEIKKKNQTYRKQLDNYRDQLLSYIQKHKSVADVKVPSETQGGVDIKTLFSKRVIKSVLIVLSVILLVYILFRMVLQVVY